MHFQKYLTKEQALVKIRQYCAYQERCHKEVKEKLYTYGLRTTDVEALLSQLIEENFLNEERFAILYAGSKFRMKQWGRKKIQYALKEKQISNYCMKKALAAISESDYKKTLHKLLHNKWDSLQHEPFLIRVGKAKNYLLQKGFESEMIDNAIQILCTK